MSGTFRWVDGPDNGVSLTSAYTNYAVGEPNNSGNEDCLIQLTNGVWNDVLCSQSYGFIVEYECPAGMEFGSTACQGVRGSLS